MNSCVCICFQTLISKKITSVSVSAMKCIINSKLIFSVCDAIRTNGITWSRFWTMSSSKVKRGNKTRAVAYLFCWVANLPHLISSPAVLQKLVGDFFLIFLGGKLAGILQEIFFRVPQKECGKRSSITFFRFRDAFGHFSVTFSDASVTFLPNSFCRTPFAAGWISDTQNKGSK